MGPRVERMVKLVRSRAGLLWSATAVEFRPVESREEHVRLLRQKLIEEAAEYVTDPKPEELADVIAVVEALAENDLGCGLRHVLWVAAERKQQRGDFDDPVAMWLTGTLNQGEKPDDQARVLPEE
jgi:predicted house-cleaning noncanonical NTP pyrophosphatase (MazG superfamily)